MYTKGNNGNYNESLIKTKIDEWYNNLSTKNKNQIIESEFCNDISLKASQRLGSNPSFACPNGIKLNLKVGIISGDEVIYTGASLSNYSSSYLNQSEGWTWTMTQASSTSMFIDIVASSGNGLWDYGSGLNNIVRTVRYVINLKNGTQVIGEGTNDNPYEVVGSIEPSQKEGDYKESQTFKVYENEGYAYNGDVSCDSGALPSYNKDTKILTISNQTKDTTCTMKFEKLKFLKDAIMTENNEIKKNPSFSTSHSDKGLFIQEGDDTKSIDGKSTYYFRGNVTNNYVKFADKTWRIVRINEDSSIRLIADSQVVDVVYTNANNSNYNESEVKKKVDSWYNGLSSENKNQIIKSEFCNDTSLKASQRLGSKPSFACPEGNKLQLSVGIISGDEVIYSGAYLSQYASSYLNQGQGNGGWTWTMTQASSTSMYLSICDSNGCGLWNHTSAFTNAWAIRYVINLKTDTQVIGEGTSSNPYVVIAS